MFRLEITSLHEFRIFVKLLRNEPIDEQEVKDLSDSLKETTNKLLAAEKALETKND